MIEMFWTLFFIAAKLEAERSYIAVLLFFYDSKRCIGFLKVFFLPEVLFVQTLFWPKSESEKNAIWTNFFWAREVFWSCAAFSEWLFDFEK